MMIAVLGTGPVGQAVAAKLADLGHRVTIGTRDVEATMARTDADHFGNPSFAHWRGEHPGIDVASLSEAAARGELVINATNGSASLKALETAGGEHLAGKVLVDLANPLDFSQGMPPTLLISNTDSLGEQIQRRFPETKVVKALNTVNAMVMVDPASLADGDHTAFVSGDDPRAKVEVAELLRSFGWTDIIDLGDITTARGTEMYLPLWARLWAGLGTPMFSVKVVR